MHIKRVPSAVWTVFSWALFFIQLLLESRSLSLSFHLTTTRAHSLNSLSLCFSPFNCFSLIAARGRVNLLPWNGAPFMSSEKKTPNCTWGNYAWQRSYDALKTPLSLQCKVKLLQFFFKPFLSKGKNICLAIPVCDFRRRKQETRNTKTWRGEISRRKLCFDFLWRRKIIRAGFFENTCWGIFAGPLFHW